MLELVLLEERYRHTAPSHMCNNRLKGKLPVLVAPRYHPGALHYLIHSYDYPLLAHKALPYAKR
jgi:hypothetical protein